MAQRTRLQLKFNGLGCRPCPPGAAGRPRQHQRQQPHAARLDCGASGGQTGEVNARALTLLLNEPQVRQGLLAHGVVLPERTWFLAGLHNTTTDEMQRFDGDLLPASHAEDLSRL